VHLHHQPVALGGCHHLSSLRLPCFSLFDPLLHLVEARRDEGSKSDVFVLLQAIRARAMPQPGESLTVDVMITVPDLPPPPLPSASL
jgi:hypothetical protein